MHIIIEAARKSAGISGLKSNYPENKKQRGAGYWAAFLGALDYQLGRFDAEYSAALKEAKTLAVRNAELEKELNEIRVKKVRNGVLLMSEKEQWSGDQRNKAMDIIAN